MTSRIETIANLCKIAGQPDRAAAFIMERRSISDVIAALSRSRTKTASELAIGTRVRVTESVARPARGADDDTAWQRIADAPRPPPTPQHGATRIINERDVFERWNELSPETVARRQWRTKRPRKDGSR